MAENTFVGYSYRGWIMCYWPRGYYVFWREDYVDTEATLENVRDHFSRVYTLVLGFKPITGALRKWEP